MRCFGCRYGIGRFTTEEEVDWAIELSVRAHKALARHLSISGARSRGLCAACISMSHALAPRSPGLQVKHVNRLREMSPLYEMHLDGIDIKSIQCESGVSVIHESLQEDANCVYMTHLTGKHSG